MTPICPYEKWQAKGRNKVEGWALTSCSWFNKDCQPLTCQNSTAPKKNRAPNRRPVFCLCGRWHLHWNQVQICLTIGFPPFVAELLSPLQFDIDTEHHEYFGLGNVCQSYQAFKIYWVVVSNMFCSSLLGEIFPICPIFFRWIGSTTNYSISSHESLWIQLVPRISEDRLWTRKKSPVNLMAVFCSAELPPPVVRPKMIHFPATKTPMKTWCFFCFGLHPLNGSWGVDEFSMATHFLLKKLFQTWFDLGSQKHLTECDVNLIEAHALYISTPKQWRRRKFAHNWQGRESTLW